MDKQIIIFNVFVSARTWFLNNFFAFLITFFWVRRRRSHGYHLEFQGQAFCSCSTLYLWKILIVFDPTLLNTLKGVWLYTSGHLRYVRSFTIGHHKFKFFVSPFTLQFFTISYFKITSIFFLIIFQIFLQ